MRLVSKICSSDLQQGKLIHVFAGIFPTRTRFRGSGSNSQDDQHSHGCCQTDTSGICGCSRVVDRLAANLCIVTAASSLTHALGRQNLAFLARIGLLASAFVQFETRFGICALLVAAEFRVTCSARAANALAIRRKGGVLGASVRLGGGCTAELPTLGALLLAACACI
jgi:hypothetical protein